VPHPETHSLHREFISLPAGLGIVFRNNNDAIIRALEVRFGEIPKTHRQNVNPGNRSPDPIPLWIERDSLERLRIARGAKEESAALWISP
jgi:hypothetical protein